MAPRRHACWADDREGAALRCLFDEGRADPTRTNGTEHMNEVYNNFNDLFGHIENTRNFHSAFRRTAAEYLTNQGLNGARCQQTEANQGPPDADEEKQADDDNLEGTLFDFTCFLHSEMFFTCRFLPTEEKKR